MDAPEQLLPPGEQDRADVYALLAGLLLSPDDAFVEGLGRLPQVRADGRFAQAWNALLQGARRGGPAVREEFDALFIAPGTPRINPYQCYYVAGWLMDKPLAGLRQDLQELGLARASGATELEDHLGALCETMHLLVRSQPLAVQQRFFARHLAGWATDCLRDLACASGADFYRAVAAFAEAFLALEAQAFAIDETTPAFQPPPKRSSHVPNPS